MSDIHCPKCNAEARSVVGVEVRGVYDGVLYWFCTACNVAWSRDWSGFGRRAEIADRLVAEHNAKDYGGAA